MATLTPTLTLSSTDATSETVSISVTDSLALGDNDAVIHRTYSPNDADPGGVQIYDTNLAKCYIYIKNIHASLDIHIVAAADTAQAAAWMMLEPGEFAYFPWAGKVDLFANSGNNGMGIAANGLEVLIWQK